VYIHHLGPAGDNRFVGNTCGSWVIHLDGALRLGPPHVDELLPVRDHLSCCDKESRKFCFSCWCHDKFDDLSYGKNGTIKAWKWIILGEVDVSPGPTAGVSFIEEPSIGMGTQNHVTGLIYYAIRRVGSNKVEEEMDSLFSGDCSLWLAGSDGTESNQKLVVHCSDVVEKQTSNFLNAAFTVVVKEIWSVGFWGELGLGTIGNRTALVGRATWLGWPGMFEFDEEVLDVTRHTDATVVTHIVPFDIDSCKFVSCHIALHTMEFLEKIKEMIEMFDSNIFDSKVVN
jgi:hypothetical protein